MIQKTLKTDIIIVGAGLVGLSFALCMKARERSIVILENHLPDIITQTQNDSRPISLSLGSVRVLKALNIWDSLSDCASPILEVHVSEQGRFGTTHFLATEQKVPALGYVVPFARLYAALYHAVANTPTIEITGIQSIEAIRSDDTQAEIDITLSNQRSTLTTDLLIAADGTQSRCRELLNITCTEKNHDDQAIIYQLALSDNHTHTAFERFTPYGILAILPLFEGKKMQLVWTITPHQAKKMADWDDADILLFLQNTFEGRLSITAIKKIAQFPLKMVIAETQIAPSAVLLGNAAHTIYPVAAQGFNLGLHDAVLLSDLLQESKIMRTDSATLKRYEVQAKQHQDKIFCITDPVISLFELPLLGCVRGLGLLATDLIKPIKNKLAKRTMGIAEKLPRLLRKYPHE